MTVSEPVRNELFDLLWSINDGSSSPGDVARLEELVNLHPGASSLYAQYSAMCGLLSWERKKIPSHDSVRERELSAGNNVPVIDDISHVANEPSLLVPPPSTTHHPLPASFVGGPVFSYMVATVVLCLMMLGAWAYKISHDQPNFDKTAQKNRDVIFPAPVFVGRITGMKDCHWSDPDTQTVVGAAVLFNRQYALVSGLLEITYSTGARVILEGPCTYKVDSSAGGFLERGKLTARIRGQRSEVRGRKSENSPLFSVKTPTATITDLGTEFGVEVAENGDTVSHVFQGSVRVESIGGVGSASVAPVKLNKGESVRVTKNAAEAVRFTHTTTMPKFVRAILHPRRNFIDLADIVAGGDGFGNARGRGIDPVTGGLLDSRVKFDHALKNDERYHPVEALPLIDGVFIPDGGQGPVQIDSVGHKFNNFPDTAGLSWHYLWSGQLPATDYPPMPCWLGMANYAGPQHSVLSMPPNKGVTFDLSAIRGKHPDVRVVRFTAVAGNTEMRSMNRFAARVSADLWVFVDGVLRFSKTDVNSNDGEFIVDVPLTKTDRFLTLAATDAGNSIECDWTIFGDPHLKITFLSNDKSKDDKNEQLPKDSSGKGGMPIER